MSVTSVTETWRDPDSHEGGQSEGERVFIVICDDVTDGTTTAAFAQDPSTGLRIPSEGDIDPDNIGRVCTGPRAYRRQDDPKVFTVVCRYVLRGARAAEARADNPLLRAPAESWGQVLMAEPATHAMQKVSGVLRRVAITNSAGEPFDPPVMREVAVPRWIVTRNERTWHPNIANQYVNCVNSLNWQAGAYYASAGHAKIISIAAEPLFEAAQYFWRVTYEIHFHPRSWRHRALDCGTKEKGEIVGTYNPPGGGTAVDIYDLSVISDRKAVAGPGGLYLLDGAGRRMDRNGVVQTTPHFVPTDSDDPDLWWRIDDEIDFAPLRLPQVPYP